MGNCEGAIQGEMETEMKRDLVNDVVALRQNPDSSISGALDATTLKTSHKELLRIPLIRESDVGVPGFFCHDDKVLFSWPYIWDKAVCATLTPRLQYISTAGSFAKTRTRVNLRKLRFLVTMIQYCRWGRAEDYS
eukprot:Blabericola_migrator_1__13220@NODE_915_length_6083_cov_15_801529_g637_i0_p2_GENE_NODE_915_length_6083_cov_15_801529_g637_i0NODE_915_length_6083_cov_15_801529_g637_i0_p2_ORF_typecomplete_len135_score0_13CLIP_SPH_Scar/PF18399_1/0_29CLIP_SPH_Scar/PF18399_1/3_4e03_NODE_915_length_6083_cov_15_801529_g637_i083487